MFVQRLMVTVFERKGNRHHDEKMTTADTVTAASGTRRIVFYNRKQMVTFGLFFDLVFDASTTMVRSDNTFDRGGSLVKEG
jgi:hypothetical protein